MKINNYHKTGIVCGLIICIAISMMVMGSAQEVYKVGQATDIKASCVNGVPVSGCTCKITILNPDGSFLVNSENMTDLGTGFYNYTTIFKAIGTYQMTQSCTDGGHTGTAHGELDITSTGYINNTTLPILLFVLGFGLLIFAVIFKNLYFGLFSGMIIAGTGVFTMIYGLGFVADAWTRMIAGVVLGVGLLIMFAAMFEMLSEDQGEVNVGFDE